jgi:hypothetical protein
LTVEGPAWSASGLRMGAGKYPLAVEQPVMARAAGREPGPACDESVLRRTLGGLLELAGQDQIRVADLTRRVDLCVCAGAGAEDGDWLAALLCGTDERAPDTASTWRRRETIRLVARIVDTHQVRAVTEDVGDVLAFGDFLVEDEVAARNGLAGEWRGLVLRNQTVSAWRRLWAWLVHTVSELTHIDGVVAALVERLPACTVEGFVGTLPPTRLASGAPAEAEVGLRDGYDAPERDLAVLAVGAARTRQLTGEPLAVFAGRPDHELTPAWFSALLDEERSSSMADFAARLAHLLVARSERVALAKTRQRSDGTLWFPARLRSLDGGWLYRTGEEGRGSVNLRLDRLGNVLVGAGVFASDQGVLTLTERGRALLG